MVGSMVEWLECCDCDQHDLISKPIRAILLCRWKRCFTALCFAWWSISVSIAFLQVSRRNIEIK